MKVKVNLVEVVFLLIAFSGSIHSQSSRVKQTPTPTPTPIPIEEVKEQVETSQINKDASKESPVKYKYLIARGVKNFISKLNEQGIKGYKLEKIVKLPQISIFGGDQPIEKIIPDEDFPNLVVAAVLKYDGETKYEYDQFLGYSPDTIFKKFGEKKESGFYFVNSLPVIRGNCGREEESANGNDISKQIDNSIKTIVEVVWGNIYILERKKGFINSSQYDVIWGSLGFGKKPTTELQTKLDEKVKNGFYPVTMGITKELADYDFVILLKKDEDSQKNTDVANRQYKFIKSEFGFLKKINKAAAEGFQIGYVGQFGAYNFALMYKEKNELVQNTYVWESTLNKKLLNDINKVVSKGGSYNSTINQIFYCDYASVRLMFESNNKNLGRNIEYKTLLMTDKFARQMEGETPDTYLEPTDQALSEFNKFIEDGYKIQSIYFYDDIYILFEKAK